MQFTLGNVSYEDRHKVIGFRRYLPDRGRENKGLIQFYARNGGLRTIEVADIVRIS